MYFFSQIAVNDEQAAGTLANTIIILHGYQKHTEETKETHADAADRNCVGRCVVPIPAERVLSSQYLPIRRHKYN